MLGHLEGRNSWNLMALESLAATGRSAVIALAAENRILDTDGACRAMRLHEDYQVCGFLFFLSFWFTFLKTSVRV